MPRPHNHWLMKPKEASGLLGITPKTMEKKFYPYLLCVLLPHRHRLLVREYIVRLVEFLDTRPITRELAHEFAASSQAARIGEIAQLRYAAITRGLANRRHTDKGLTPPDIVSALGVDVKLAYRLRDKKPVSAASPNGQKFGTATRALDPAEFLALCPLQGPGCR